MRWTIPYIQDAWARQVIAPIVTAPVGPAGRRDLRDSTLDPGGPVCTRRGPAENAPLQHSSKRPSSQPWSFPEGVPSSIPLELRDRRGRGTQRPGGGGCHRQDHRGVPDPPGPHRGGCDPDSPQDRDERHHRRGRGVHHADSRGQDQGRRPDEHLQEHRPDP